MDDFSFSTLDNDEIETTNTLPAPVKFPRRVEKRKFLDGMRKQALTELIGDLPPPDTDLYILSNGSGGTYHLYEENASAFEFGHFISVLVGMLGAACTVYVSTWTMNRQHALNMLQLFDDGAIAHLAVMTDPYFLRREAAVANQLVSGLMARRQRFKAFKNHVKAVAMSNADGTRFVTVLASANLFAQPRAENFTLTTAPDVYAFVKERFFEVMLNA